MKKLDQHAQIAIYHTNLRIASALIQRQVFRARGCKFSQRRASKGVADFECWLKATQADTQNAWYRSDTISRPR
jgi:hypothetical protein